MTLNKPCGREQAAAGLICFLRESYLVLLREDYRKMSESSSQRAISLDNVSGSIVETNGTIRHLVNGSIFGSIYCIKRMKRPGYKMRKMTTAILLFDLMAGVLILGFYGMRSRAVTTDSGIVLVAEEELLEEADVKKIAITFDDGPHPSYTAQLLDGLKERGKIGRASCRERVSHQV